jgi:hypothetical protein
MKSVIVVSCRVLSCLVLCCPALSCLVLSCFVLSCPVLSWGCLVFSGPILSDLSLLLMISIVLSYGVVFCCIVLSLAKPYPPTPIFISFLSSLPGLVLHSVCSRIVLVRLKSLSSLDVRLQDALLRRAVSSVYADLMKELVLLHLSPPLRPGILRVGVRG